MSKRIAVSANPQITIESVDGDMRLVGWDVDEILLKVDDESLDIQQNEDQITLSCKDDLSMNVPKDALVHIVTVNGDMSVRGLTGDFSVENANGDVSMRDAGNVSFGAIGSDFVLRGAKGNVLIKSVGGDASLRAIDGNLTIDSVSDDLAIRGVGGDLKVDVDEDVVVHIEPKPDQKYTVTAGDDILLVLPPQPNAKLNLSGDRIQVDFPTEDEDDPDATTRVVTLGDGTAEITLSAGDKVVVTSRLDAAESADEYGNFAGMMFDWENWGREIGQHWGNVGQDFGERISRRAHEAAERAARKAERAGRKAEKAARKIELQVEHDMHHHRKHGRGTRFSWTWDSNQMPKVSRPDPVSEEERLTILRMLADKKISSEEAEKLLSALEGGG